MKELQQVPLPCQCSSEYRCRVSAPASTVAVSVLRRVPLPGLVQRVLMPCQCSSEYRCRVSAPASTVAVSGLQREPLRRQCSGIYRDVASGQ